MAEGKVIRVMIVDDIADTCEQLEKLLFFEPDIEVVHKAHNGVEAVEMARKLNPDVVLMDINMPEKDGISATKDITTENPNTQIIIMSVQGETEYLRRAMHAGAREFLIKPISSEELYKAIRSVPTHRVQVAPQTQQQGSKFEEQESSDEYGEIISVFSPKGGVGTSTIAANLAVALRQLTKKKVALFDGRLILGDLGIILNLPANKTISDIVGREDDLDSDLLNNVLTTHNSQIKVLLSPLNPEDVGVITVDNIRTILDFMRQEFDYIIIDSQSDFQGDRALAMLDMADRIALLMTLEMSCIKNVKRFLEIADIFEYPPEKIFLVLNKADHRLGIRVSNIESNLKHKVALQIGNAAHEMTISTNNGVPFVISNRDHSVTRDIFLLAKELSDTSVGEREEEHEQEGQHSSAGERRKQEKKKKGLLGLFS